ATWNRPGPNGRPPSCGTAITFTKWRTAIEMPSPFDPQRPGPTVESKIVVALERVATAFRVLLWNEGRTHGLSPIQVQLLLFLRFHPRERCKVSVLAQEFNLTKATISESVRALELKG